MLVIELESYDEYADEEDRVNLTDDNYSEIKAELSVYSQGNDIYYIEELTGYKLISDMMDEEEFDNLPEFDGF